MCGKHCSRHCHVYAFPRILTTEVLPALALSERQIYSSSPKMAGVKSITSPCACSGRARSIKRSVWFFQKTSQTWYVSESASANLETERQPQEKKKMRYPILPPTRELFPVWNFQLFKACQRSAWLPSLPSAQLSKHIHCRISQYRRMLPVTKCLHLMISCNAALKLRTKYCSGRSETRRHVFGGYWGRYRAFLFSTRISNEKDTNTA